jgi:putative ABC transport system ATP-binding protein
MSLRSNPIIQLRNVVKAYSTGYEPFIALRNVDLDIHAGEFLGITGKSGAGKTTLLNMISGVSDLTSGEIIHYNGGNGKPVEGTRLSSLSEDKLAIWRGNNLGIVYQSFELMPNLNLVENVMLPPDFLGKYHPEITKNRALKLLEQVDIIDHAYKIPAHISGGQKQRVAIARALVNDPPLIIADEPTGNLDSVTAETIFKIFERLVEEGKTIVMVTHDESLASRFSRRLHIIDGEIIDPNTRNKQSNSKSPIKGINKATTLGSGKNHSKNGNSKNGQNGKHPAIVLRGVDKVYENAAGKFIALRNISLALDYGQFISIVGKSGCGKSTLLNMITGIDHPTAGDVKIGKENIYHMSESQRALWRGKNVGVVFQFFQLLPTLSLLENTMLPMDFCDIYSFAERPQKALELLKMVGLEKQAHKLPAAVSSGQQQCAAIARAMATDPAIILADEPTGNLDSKSAETVLNLFEDLAARGKTILIVTHDPSITKRTDQTIILSDGEIIDQTIARTLPYLSHPQMLEATKNSKRRIYQPGQIIIQESIPVIHFFMIVSGEVEVVLNTNQPNEMVLTTLGEGKFFGEISLTKGTDATASVRASAVDTEVAVLSKEIFTSLINESQATREIITEVAENRLAETNQIRGNKNER